MVRIVKKWRNEGMKQKTSGFFDEYWWVFMSPHSPLLRTKDQPETTIVGEYDSKMIWSKRKLFWVDFQRCRQFWVHMLRQPTAKLQQNMWNLLGHTPVSDLCSPWHFSVGKGRRFFFGDARISRFCLRVFRRVKPLRCVWRNRETPRNWWNVWVLFLHRWFSVKRLENTCFLGEDFKKCVGFASQIHSRFPFLVLNYWCRIFPRFACEKIEVCSTNWRSGGSSF